MTDSTDSEPTEQPPRTEEREDDAATDTPDDKLLHALTSFKEDVQERVRGMLRAKKASERLCRDGALENLDLVRKYADWLRDVDLEPIDMEDRRRKAVESLDTFVKRRRNRRRMEFMRGLDRLAGDRDLEFEKLSESPLTMYVEPFVVAPDFETGDVEVRYARETIGDAALNPEAVFEVHDRELDRLERKTAPPEAFFDNLQLAYELARTSRHRDPGERVDLVDLLGPLSLLDDDPDDWRSADLSDVEPYPRHRLAYQLQRLRRAGELERDDTRIDLGTATGGSTEDKRDVLFIPSGPDDGQYYLSIRFVDETR